MQPTLDGNSDRHQGRFLSSSAFQRGLSALTVSSRCAFLLDEDELSLIWMLQQLSWRAGGLRELAKEMLFGMFHGRANLPALRFANTDPVAWLTYHLESACIQPDYSFDKVSQGRYWNGDFAADLRAYRERLAALAGAKFCSTEISKAVFEALDYALQSPGSMTLCYGPAGLGKTEPARQWCEMRPGVARYIETPAVENERSFYSAIAEELGIPRGTTYNGQQTSLRIIDVLKESRLMLVLDEAHRLWPQKNRPQGSPVRIVWLTTLVNAGVPVGLIAMPEFFKRKQLFVRWTNWSDTQFNRRLSMVKELPTLLCHDDLRSVARHVMPGGSPACHDLLVTYAQASKINLSAITETLRTARFLAKKAGRSEALAADIQKAIREVRAPLDCILAAEPESLCAPEDSAPAAPKRRRGRPRAALPRGIREPSAPEPEEEGEPAETELLPRQIRPFVAALSPAAR